MKKLLSLLAVFGLLATACNKVDYPKILRARLTKSGNLARTFMYKTVGKADAYTVRGRVEDDLRYAMELSHQGRPLMEYIVRDDALSVRLRDPEFGKRLANTLGDPVVDAALKEGRWVTDPAGAPPLVKTNTTSGTELTGDPLQDARDVLDFVTKSMAAARDVRLFTLDDVEYRSQLDPWEYPKEDSGEVRYDLRRPFLPTSQAAAGVGAATGSVGPPQFRKTSVYVRNGEVERVCSLIDVEGHEEFIALRQRGLKSNPFLADLLRQIEKGTSPVPIEPRYIVAEIRYPRDVSVDVPGDTVTGRLETFQSVLKQGVESGVLRPTKRPDISDCRRKTTETG
jgi:hypothetical protein